jgi:hypothetical protein
MENKMQEYPNPTPRPTLDQSDAGRVIEFFLANSTTGVAVTGAAGTLVAKLIKAGAAPATPGGTIAEIGLGWYKLTCTAADLDTAGDLILNVSQSGATTVNDRYTVIGSQAVNNVSWSFTRDTGLDNNTVGYVYLQQASGLPFTLGTGANR